MKPRAHRDALVGGLVAVAAVAALVKQRGALRRSEARYLTEQRRAAAAKRYLVERGVAEGRVETTSFGEERPVCTTSDESCWAQNRRDEFEMTAGGPTLTRPRS